MLVEYFGAKKSPNEVVPIVFDFSNKLPNGIESLLTLSISVKNGADSNVSSMPLGSAVVNGSVVTQLLQGGVSGTTYLITCYVGYGQIKYEIGGYLVVEEVF